jgi:glycine betaine/proline transport system substrate-binding protein
MSFRIRAALASAILALSLGAVTSAQAAGRLTAPDPDWTGGLVTCLVAQYILENEMDYRIKRVTMPSGPGVFEGTRSGDLDFACESWPSYNPAGDKYIKEFGGDGSVAYLGATGIVGKSGYFVPRYVIEGDASWLCEDQKRLDMLGVDFHAQALGSETAHWAEIQAKYKRGEPFVAYAWAPHWIHAALDLVEIELPPYDEAKWPATNWAQDVTHFHGNPKMLDEHSDVVKLLQNMNLTNEMQAGMIYDIDVKKGDSEEVVESWMEANEDIWRKWLP